MLPFCFRLASWGGSVFKSDFSSSYKSRSQCLAVLASVGSQVSLFACKFRKAFNVFLK